MSLHLHAVKRILVSVMKTEGSDMRHKMLFGALVFALSLVGLTVVRTHAAVDPDFTQPYRDSSGHVLLSKTSGTRDLLFICIHPLNGWPMMNLNEVREITNMAQRWF